MADFSMLRRMASIQHDEMPKGKVGYGGKYHQRGQNSAAKPVTKRAAESRGRRTSYQMGEDTHGKDAKAIFEKYDVDSSGTIEPNELEDALFDLGINLTRENIAAVRAECGCVMETESIGFSAFLTWYNKGPGATANARKGKLDKLDAKVRKEYIPWIRHLFDTVDNQERGSLNKEEFLQFYPTLREYWELNEDYQLPKAADCMEEMDKFGMNGFGGEITGNNNGEVEYKEFEAWFINHQMQRAKDTAKAEDVIKNARVDIRGLMKSFGSAKPNLARSSSSDSVGGASGGGGIGGGGTKKAAPKWGGGGAIGISAVSSYVPPLSKVPDVIRRGGVPAASGGSTRGAAPGAPLKSISELFNYGSVDFSAAEIFEKYDTDNSGTIDAHELDAMLYELGIKVSKTKMEQARKELGITKYTGEVGLFDFEEWWRKGYGSNAAMRRKMLTKLSTKMRDEYMPHIKALFAKADTDKSGDLDRMEFEVFYPDLREYLGYPLPPITQCMNEIDAHSEQGGIFGNGLIEYVEFESWFLATELCRAQSSAEFLHGM